MIESLKQLFLNINPNIQIHQSVTTNKLLRSLDACQKINPKEFANYLNSLIDIAENYSLECTIQQKLVIFQMIISCLEMFPLQFNKDPSLIERLFDLTCRIMANISETWYNPPGDYDQDDFQKLISCDPDSALIYLLKRFIERLGYTAGFGKIIKIIQQKAIISYKDGDWRGKNAVLICLSRLSKNIEVDEINNIIYLLKIGINDQNPKVRFAAAELLSQLSHNLGPQFQNKYFREFMPLIMKGMEDPFERVASNFMGSIFDLVEFFADPIQILPYVNPILEKVCQFILKGNRISKLKSVLAMSSLLTISFIFNQQTIRKPFQICHSILQTFSIKEYKLLINRSIYLLTVAINNQPYLLIKNYINFTVQLFNQICKDLDSQLSIRSWSEICGMGHPFQKWEQLYLQIYERIKQTQIHNMKIGLNAISATVDTFKELFNPYAIKTFQFLFKTFESAIIKSSNQVAICVIETIQKVMIKAKPSNPDDNWNKRMKQYIQLYIDKVRYSIETNLFSYTRDFLISVKAMISEYIYLFTQEELRILLQKFWDFSNNLKSMKNEKMNLLQQPQMGLEPEQIDQNKQEIQVLIFQIKLSKTTLIELICAVTKRLSDPSASIQRQIENVKFSIINAADEEDIYQAIFFIDNLLENFDYQILKEYWEEIYNLLSKFCMSTDASIRRATIFGLGILAEKTPVQLVNIQMINNCIQIMKNAQILPNNPQQPITNYQYCQDNCKGAIGKVLKKFHNNFNLEFIYDDWLETLPLKHDRAQNEIQIKNLCDFLQKQPQMLISSSSIQEGVQRLRRIMKIFAQFISWMIRKIYNQMNIEIIRLSKQTITKIISWQIFKQNQEKIMQDVTAKERFILGKLMQSDLMTTI